MEDKRYCMSSFLMFRTVADGTKSFDGKSAPNLWEDVRPRKGIHDSRELEEYLRNRVLETCGKKRAALALSGGMDSAILAKFMPEGSVCYTFRCIVPGMQVTDETAAAARYAESCGLKHRIVPIYWEDFEAYAPVLMAHKHAPFYRGTDLQGSLAGSAGRDGNAAFRGKRGCGLWGDGWAAFPGLAGRGFYGTVFLCHAL